MCRKAAMKRSMRSCFTSSKRRPRSWLACTMLSDVARVQETHLERLLKLVRAFLQTLSDIIQSGGNIVRKRVKRYEISIDYRQRQQSIQIATHLSMAFMFGAMLSISAW